MFSESFAKDSDSDSIEIDASKEEISNAFIDDQKIGDDGEYQGQNIIKTPDTLWSVPIGIEKVSRLSKIEKRMYNI